MTVRTNHADAIGGLCLLAAAMIGVLALALDGWRTYAPAVRGWLIAAAYSAHDIAAALLDWRTAVGVLIGALGAVCIAYGLERIDP